MGTQPTELSFDGLRSGRYRARDALTGLVSKHLDVEARERAEFTLDLARAGPITGRVEGPADGDFGEAIVLVEGTEIQSASRHASEEGIRVRLNSDFKARVPGDRPVTLRVEHPLLVPSPDAGSATVTVPGASVVLKLLRGAEAIFRVAGATNRKTESFRPDRILLFAGKPEGEPIRICEAKYKDGVGRIGGFEPGSYTLWCDLPPAAPLILRDVVLGAATTDLGELTRPEGATIRVKVQTREGQQTTRIDISATPIEGPFYSRIASSPSGATEAALGGIGPGRFKVEVRTGDSRAAPKQHEVVSTGAGEILLTVDLR
jgi:hypothetical protein